MRQQSGNVLWMILLGIALLGAITAMFTRSSGTSDETGEYEQRTLNASEIMRYASSVELAVQNLLNSGCSENEISFWHDSNGDGDEDGDDEYYNDNSPGNRSCHVFAQQGAGLTYRSAASLGAGYITYTSNSDIKDVGVSNCGNASCAELYIFMSFLGDANQRKTCDQINKALGHDDLVPAPSTTAVMASPVFTGSFANYHYASNPLFSGKTSACYIYASNPDGDQYMFYHVLIAR